MLYPYTKRLFDIVLSGLGLLLLAPAFALIGLIIKLTDPGPVFYRQVRIGRWGRPFWIWKFRTMVVNAQDMGPLITNEKDPRITLIGRILRKTKVDELPQLWNVLRGEMSFVGPRPQVPRFISKLNDEQREMLRHRPGITDLASLKFRDEEELLSGAPDVEDFYIRHCLPRKIALNLQYSRDASLGYDLWIILQTLCPYWLAVSTVYALSLIFSFWLCYQLLTDFHITDKELVDFKRFLPFIVGPQLLTFMWRGQLRGLLSYFSIPEMKKTVVSLSVALAAQFLIFYSSQGAFLPSRSILLLDYLLSFCTLCAVRMGLRLLRERGTQRKPQSPASVRRVGIIGTGELATNLLLDFNRSTHPPRRVLAFFDDDPLNWRKRPHDIPVVGMPECLLSAEWQRRLDEVIITLNAEQSERIHQICQMLKKSSIKVTVASNWPEVGKIEEEIETEIQTDSLPIQAKGM